MDKGFLRHLKDKKDALLIAVVLALGLLLIFIGDRDDGVTEVSSQGIEDRLATACSGIEGVGECSVLVYYGAAQKGEAAQIESVIIICEGADSSEVRLELTRTLSSFLGIGANRIRIEKMRH